MGNDVVTLAFYQRSVHAVARDLIGCTLLYRGVGGVIVETESYHAEDPACHAYVGRTERNAVLFGPPGRVYVYLSYGIHNLLNVVAEPEDQPAAVLIRALEPVQGTEQMRRRRGISEETELCSGPGKLTQALGIGLDLNGSALGDGGVAILPRSDGWREPRIKTGSRIGISKATDLQWRFCADRSDCVSRPRP